MPTIAVDAMGGEGAPEETVRGVAEVSLETGIDCLLLGDEARIQAVLERVPCNPEQIAIRHCPETIAQADDPREAVRTRRNASLLVAIRAVAEGRADAAVSAGNAGACLLGAARHFRPLPGVRRAALAEVFPRRAEHPGQDPLALLLDAGATVHCDVDELVRFAAMGSAWARRVSKVPAPRVGLLNTGAEPGSGGELLAETHRRLAALPGLNFVGNVEGRELIAGKADVIVCEGLLGAVALGLYAGISEALLDVARAAAERTLVWRMGLRLLAQGIDTLQALADYRRYGGAPILGFEQLLLRCRARSDARAIANAVKVAARAVRDRVPAEMADALGGGRP